jgi:hypothetical protein
MLRIVHPLANKTREGFFTEVLTLKDAASEYGLHPQRLLSAAHSDKLRCDRKEDGSFLLRRRDIERWLKREIERGKLKQAA